MTHEPDVFGQITSDISHHLHHVILVELMPSTLEPESHIFVAGRMLGERGKPGYLALLELIQKPRVFGPEKPDIRYSEQEHRYSFQPNAESPAYLVGHA